VTLDTSTAVSVTVLGTSEKDTIAGVENVYGGAGSDHIIGDGLKNELRGNAGNDILDGGVVMTHFMEEQELIN